jgi:hypothetical protein
MVRAFFDDSGIGQSPVYCLAGLVSNAAVWAEFSNEWSTTLKSPPSLNYWKTTHAISFRGQFTRWDREDRDQKLREFIEIISKYPVVPFAFTVNHGDWIDVFGGHERLTPYAYMLMTVYRSLGEILAENGLSNEPVDFIFDNQPERISEITRNWSSFVDSAPSHYGGTLKNFPIFENEKKVLPLQAADLVAWYVRKQEIHHYQGTPFRDNLFDDKRLFHALGDKQALLVIKQEMLSAYLRSLRNGA